jgi:hypothetical protein
MSMLARKMALLAALVAIGVVGGGAAPASASIWAHGGTNTGNVLADGTTIAGSLQAGTNATLTSSIGTITCTTSVFSDTLGPSGGTTLGGTPTNVQFGSATTSACSDTLPIINYHDCSYYADAANPSSVVSGSTVTTTTNTPTAGQTTAEISLASTVTVACHLSTGGTCYFRANDVIGVFKGWWTTASGVAGGNSLSYTNVAVAQPASPVSSFTCPSSGTFNASYAGTTVTSGPRVGELLLVNANA